jgi:iron(III) transport system substrate-binding protein
MGACRGIAWPGRLALAVRASFAYAACLFALSGCDKGASSSPKRTVVVYTSLDQVFSEPILMEFERQTGIHVAPVYDAESSKTTGLVTRLLASRDRPDCDVFWNNEAVQTQRLAREGLLEAYQSPAAARFRPEHRDANGFWTGFSARARVLVYNTQLVSEADAPTGLADLTAPRWRGKVAVAVPLFGTTLTHMAYLRNQWGAERLGAWLAALKANDVALCPGNAAVRDLVASGEKAMGLTDTDDAYGALSAGKPIRIVIPDANAGAVLIPNTVSVVRNCPHAAEARLLVDYLLSAGVEKALAAGESVQIPLATDLADLPTPWREHLRGVTCRLDVAAVAERLEDTMKLLEEKGMDR